MKQRVLGSSASELACEVCGQLPHPHKVRLTLANVAAMLPIELLVHAAVVNTDMPYIQKVIVLTLTATVLVIWVAEPSVRRGLRHWLHAPSLRHIRRLHATPAVWRIRAVTNGGPVAQWKLTRALAGENAEILDLQHHPSGSDVLSELIVSAPESTMKTDLLSAAHSGGAHNVMAWQTTALAMADGQTKALSLAVRVAGNPDELQLAVAELLGAELVPEHSAEAQSPTPGNVLKIPSPAGSPLFFSRPQAPFTQAESARAHRLAELAELSEQSQGRRTPLLMD